MFCRNCGHQNPDGSTFCAACGSRLIDEQPTVAQQPQPQPQPYVAAPAVAPAPVQEPVVEQPVAEVNNPEPLTGWKKIVNLVGGALAMAAAVFSFIFTFLINVGYDVMGEFVAKGSFIDIFENLLDIFESDNIGAAIAMLMQYMFQSILNVAIIITELVLLIQTLIRYIKSFKNPNSDFGKPAITAFFTYLAGCVVTLGLYASGSDGVGIGFDPITTVGIVLGALFIFLFVASQVAIKGKGAISKNGICRMSFGAGYIVFGALLLSFLASGLYQSEGGYAAFIYLMEGTINPVSGEILAGRFILGMFGQIFQMILTVIVARGFINALRRTYEDDQTRPGALAFPIVDVIFSVILLILTIAVSALEEMAMVELAFTNAILVLVFAILNLATAITDKVLSNKFKE